MLSYLNLNFTLSLCYLNPALNHPAQMAKIYPEQMCRNKIPLLYYSSSYSNNSLPANLTSAMHNIRERGIMRPLLSPTSFSKDKHVLRSHPWRREKWLLNTSASLFTLQASCFPERLSRSIHFGVKRPILIWNVRSGGRRRVILWKIAVLTASVNWSGLNRPAPKTLETPVGLK